MGVKGYVSGDESYRCNEGVVQRRRPQGAPLRSNCERRADYKTTVKTAKATMMPVAMMPILRISKGNVRA